MRGEKKFEVLSIRDGEGGKAEDKVAVEEPIALYVNGTRLATLLYTPPMAIELAVGHLFSEGLIAGRDDITSLSVRKGLVLVEIKGEVPTEFAGRTITSGCGAVSAAYPANLRQIKKIKGGPEISQERILELADSFRKMSRLFEETGGVHSAALSDGADIIVFADDIGRHNAADKVFGACLMEGIDAAGKILLTTGRISSEITLKAAKNGVAIVISRSAPTSLAIHLAERLGVTLVGFARGKRMNVYTHSQRVELK